MLGKLSGKNINFLIGSGASFPMYDTLSLGDDKISFEDLLSSDELDDCVEKVMYYYYYVNWIEKMFEFPNENLIGSDDAKRGVLDNYYKLVKTILAILDTNGNEKPKRANIFTTNYDLLFEYTFEEILKKRQNCYFNDGSRGFKDKILSPYSYSLNVSEMGYYDGYKREVPTINLYKIHGSVSWKNQDSQIYVVYDKSNDEIEAIENFDCEKIKEFLSVFATKDRTTDFDDVINFNDVMGWSSESRPKIDGQLSRFIENYKKLAIINPNKWKFHETVFEQHYYQLIRNFSYELEKPDTVLIVFAFSFADEHIEEIFKRSLGNPSLEVIIICYSENDRKVLEKKFVDFKNISYFPTEFKNKDGSSANGNFTYLNKFLNGGFDDE